MEPLFFWWDQLEANFDAVLVSYLIQLIERAQHLVYNFSFR